MKVHKCVYHTDRFGYAEHTFKSAAHTSSGLIKRAIATISEDSFFNGKYVTKDEVGIVSIDDVPVHMLTFASNLCW